MTVRTDLDGLRVKSPAWRQDEVYLIDEGKRRWIPDPPTYENLFRDWDGIILDIDIADIDQGSNITSGAVLATALGDPKVYLVDGNLKRWITSPDAMDRYYFNWGRIQVVPSSVLNPLPDGPDINA